LHIPVAATELCGQFRGQPFLFPGGHEDDGSTPRASRDLVVGVVQQRPRDRGPRIPVPDLGQRMQRLASGLSALGTELRAESGHRDLRREAGQRPRKHVAHEEVRLDRAPCHERIDEAGVGVRANRQSRLEPRRRVSGAQRVEQARVL
jgi:hypothetical protein